MEQTPLFLDDSSTPESNVEESVSLAQMLKDTQGQLTGHSSLPLMAGPLCLLVSYFQLYIYWVRIPVPK